MMVTSSVLTIDRELKGRLAGKSVSPLHNTLDYFLRSPFLKLLKLTQSEQSTLFLLGTVSSDSEVLEKNIL